MTFLDQVRSHKRLVLLCVLLSIPSASLVVSDAVYIHFAIPSLPSMSAVGPPVLTVTVTPAEPFIPNTPVWVLVSNRTDEAVEEALVTVGQYDGTVLREVKTNGSGMASFLYPGRPVSVRVEHKDYQIRQIVVGLAPAEWYLATGLLYFGICLLGVTGLYYYIQSAGLRESLAGLEKEYDALRQQVMSVRDMSEMKLGAEKVLADEALLLSTQNPYPLSQLMEFVDLGGIGEQLVIGIALFQYQCQDMPFNRKVTLFVLSQTFEDLLLHLGRVQLNAEVQQRFMSAERPSIGWMLKHLFPTGHDDIHRAVQTYGAFDRRASVLDFEAKLDFLLGRGSGGTQATTRPVEPALTFTVVTLVRNFTHHCAALGAHVYSDDNLFRTSADYVLRAILAAYLLLGR